MDDDRWRLLEVLVPVPLPVVARLHQDLAVGHHEPDPLGVLPPALPAGGRELDRRRARDTRERRRHLGQRRIVAPSHPERRHEQPGGEGDRSHGAVLDRMRLPTTRVSTVRGTNLSVLVMRLLSVPFTSTVRLPTAASASAATASADIQAKPGTAPTSTAALSWNSVRVNPGQTHRTRTPVPRSSSAIASVKLSTNALVAL